MNATTHRLLSLAFAAVMTVGMLAGVDHLAQSDAVAPATTLAATAAPRA